MHVKYRVEKSVGGGGGGWIHFFQDDLRAELLPQGQTEQPITAIPSEGFLGPIIRDFLE